MPGFITLPPNSYSALELYTAEIFKRWRPQDLPTTVDPVFQSQFFVSVVHSKATSPFHSQRECNDLCPVSQQKNSQGAWLTKGLPNPRNQEASVGVTTAFWIIEFSCLGDWNGQGMRDILDDPRKRCNIKQSAVWREGERVRAGMREELIRLTALCPVSECPVVI